ncbi:MAG: GH92 family glycosyl hydrolase [Bacteroidota bacterium]
MKSLFLASSCLLMLLTCTHAQESPLELVNPFIGTSNYGTTNPGPIAVRGMANVSPFNVAGEANLPFDKDSRWWSTPYVNENTFLTGFSHLNLSGVGCPELGVILAMPTTGELETDHRKYGSTYSEESAKVGYYTNTLDKYGVKVEATATTRVGVSRYHFPAGDNNILLNLGLGLTNEQGASVRVVSPTEIEGSRSVGTFCYYKPNEAYQIYFVARFSEAANETGVWKDPPRYEGVEAQWMGYNGQTRIMPGYRQPIIGDSIGAYLRYQFDAPKTVEMQIGISYVSIENARENLEREAAGKSFDQIMAATQEEWAEHLSRVEVEGGTRDDQVIFYTALYHTLIHPNTLNDHNGEYPHMQTRETMHTDGIRFTTFSLWDTYRNLHQLMSLLYPEQQVDMVNSMLRISDESGWLPKWELNATETTTMVGDPAGIVITDTYLKGIRGFDVEKAYAAMVKSADQRENNPLRPGLGDYLDKGYLTTATTNSGSVSTTQEYNISDFAIAELAKELGKTEDYERFSARSLSYRKLLDQDLNLLRPRNDDGSWLEPYEPETGANFVKNLGFIEGNAWQYTFMVSHDALGLMEMMGGRKPYAEQLQKVFDLKQFDMANEPDIGYPYLFTFAKGYEQRTPATVTALLNQHYKNAPDGLPGNDDTGTMSAWAVFSMLGFYPAVPASPTYSLSTPRFSKVRLRLNPDYYPNETLEIRTQGSGTEIQRILVDGKVHKGFQISHAVLTGAKVMEVVLR